MKRKDLLLNENKIGKTYVADNFFLRLRGLIGRDPEKMEALWIEPCSQIHTFMMSAPIDVVYLNRDGIVLKIEKNIPPSRCQKSVKHSRAVVEFPAYQTEKLNINIGDAIKKSDCKVLS